MSLWFCFPDVEHLFMCLLAICMSLEKTCIQSLCPFFNWIFCCSWIVWVSSLHILDTNPLSGTWFANVFSQEFSWMVSFVVQKSLHWYSSTIFCFCCFCSCSQIQIIITKTFVKEFAICVFFLGESPFHILHSSL